MDASLHNLKRLARAFRWLAAGDRRERQRQEHAGAGMCIATCAACAPRRRKRGGTGVHAVAGCAAIDGAERVARVLEVDQTPIGKTPRSCPATYVGFWDDIRQLVRRAPPEATHARLQRRPFSFNVAGGRCEECRRGQGVRKIEMKLPART